MSHVHLLVYFLMMETEQVSEMDFCSKFMWLVMREDFITLTVRDIVEQYSS
jgi:hypothetical protein